jgi:small subunit ribosomal protein S20
MANIKSAKLRIKKSQRKAENNRYWKNKVKEILKSHEANATSKAKSKTSFSKVQVVIDKAVAKKVISKNKAARIKSRLSKA